MQQKGTNKEQFAEAPQPKKVMTTLDSLPAGDLSAPAQKTSVKHPLPDGVTSGMLYNLSLIHI